MIAGLKIALLVIFFAALAPLQWLALKFGWPLAGRIPVLFHRFAARLLNLKVREIGAMAAVRPLLVVSNHTSWVDIVTLGSRAPLSFIAKSEVSTWPAVRTLARLQRTIFVDRTRRAATGETTAAIGRRLAAGDPMVLFAEGTTSDGERVLPFRSALIGAAQALEGETAFVQPVVVGYVRRHGTPIGRARRPDIAWYGDMDLLPHLKTLLGSGGALEAVIVWGESRPAGPGMDRKRRAADLEVWARETYAGIIRGRS